jgi:hypothetical protein
MIIIVIGMNVIIVMRINIIIVIIIIIMNMIIIIVVDPCEADCRSEPQKASAAAQLRRLC